MMPTSKIIVQLFLAFAVLLFVNNTHAQSLSDASLNEPIRDLKVLYEYNEGDKTITVVEYKQGSMRVKETITKPRVTKVTIGLNVAIKGDTADKNKFLILVDKSDYTLEVRYKNKPIRAYRAVFGPYPQQNKCMEGDRCTPEGEFRIAAKNPASKYTKFLLLNYPNETVMQRFKRLKDEGKIPRHKHVGGDIGIHGIWKGGDDLIEMGIGWTDGCVALKNKDIEDLYSLVPVGTRVVISK